MITQWQAVYDSVAPDRAVIVKQLQEDGTKLKYKDIDRDRLRRFDLLDEAGQILYSVFLSKDKRLIYRRRTLIQVNRATNEEIQRQVVWLLGYQMTVQGENFVIINYIFEDGRVELDHSRNNLELFEEER